MPKSLVTGGAGFIGSHVARHCLGLGHEVVVLDDLSGGYEDNMPAGATFRRGSVTDEALVARLFARAPLRLRVPSGGLRGRGTVALHPPLQLQNNVVGTVNLVNAAVNADTRPAVRVHEFDRRLRGRPRIP